MGAPLLLSSMRRKANDVFAQPTTRSAARNSPAPLLPATKFGVRASAENKVPLEGAEGTNGAGRLLPNGSRGGGSQRQKPMRLYIAPDGESESMQVNLLPQSPSPKAKENVQRVDTAKHTGGGGVVGEEPDTVYSVGGVDYFVNHNDNGERHAHGKQTQAEAMAGGGSERRKPKMGNLFRKSPHKGNSSGGNQEQGNNAPHGGNTGDQNGDEKDDKEGNGGGGDGKKDVRMSAHAPFGPARIRFAQESTLPLHPGSEATAPRDHPSWTPASGTEFQVRTGPNYAKTGKKAASAESLYEVYSVRYFRSARRTVGGATRILPLPAMGERTTPGGGAPHAEGGTHDEAHATADAEEEGGARGDGVPRGRGHPELQDTALPDVLVVHFMLPYETPNVFGQKDDGGGGECVYYLRPSRTLLDEIAGRAPASPAARLFARWCAECRTDPKMRARFKCMALVRDIDKHNFGMLKSYNGKPVLITESGRVGQGHQGGVRYLEMAANVHHWAFMAKKGFVSLIPKFTNMQMEVGFTIEGRTDQEMPECMLGSTVLSYVSKNTGPLITKEMQEPVHEHQS